MVHTAVIWQDAHHFLTCGKFKSRLGKKAIRFSAADAWNRRQSELHFETVVSLNQFKAIVKYCSLLYLCAHVLCEKVLTL